MIPAHVTTSFQGADPTHDLDLRAPACGAGGWGEERAQAIVTHFYPKQAEKPLEGVEWGNDMNRFNICTGAVALRIHCREQGKRGSREAGKPTEHSGGREEGEADGLKDLS